LEAIFSRKNVFSILETKNHELKINKNLIGHLISTNFQSRTPKGILKCTLVNLP